MNISPPLFEAYLKCPTKCWRRAQGEVGDDNAYATWVRTQAESYVSESARRLASGITDPESTATGPEHVTLKTAQWLLALEVAAECQTESCTLESRLHAVERVPSEGRGKAAQFIPIRFIYRNKLTKDDKLLLAFDAFVLSEMLGRAVSLGKIIHGDLRGCARQSAANSQEKPGDERTDAATETTAAPSEAQPRVTKVKTSALAGEVRKRLEKMTALLSNPAPPDLVLNRHCAECEFHARCRKIAIEKDDLSLLANMSAKERKGYRNKGIFTVTQLSYTFRPRRRPKRLRDKREKYHHALKALAIREKKIHIVGSPELKIEGTPVYLDVEGLPDRDFYYLIGLRIGHGESAVQHSLWADTVADEGKIWREFIALLLGVRSPVLVHYGSYEISALKVLQGRYGGPQPESATAKAFSRPLNLLSTIYDQVYFPTFSNGLKEIAGCLGFQWSPSIASGIVSIAWRQSWETSRDANAKEKLIAYNTDDCKALQLATKAIIQVSGSVPCGVMPIVRTDSLKPQKASKWGTLTSPIQEFESISRAGHWNYQRDRIKIRQGKNPAKIAKPKRRVCQRVRKVIVHDDLRNCPRCGNVETGEPRVLVRCFEDIVFGRFSMKRRLVRHEFSIFRCSKCRHQFGIPDRFQISRKYGWNLISFVFYQSIGLNIPQRVVVKNLNRLFGFALNPSTVATLKTSVTRYYAATFRQILNRIVEGGVLHADETGANVKGTSAYIWVFCNTKNVAYIYAETREGDLLHKHLKDFKGVLVSDFYAAYDGMDCPQQKCLIHLLREFNNELMDNPYDEELKKIAQEFADLLKSMVDTADRFGLKCYHLKKHKKPVERFYESLAAREFKTEAAIKCKSRFEKCRDGLFTFLEHNDVPWNNNNAEHAIKAFARLRDVLAGSVTATALEDYLVLLSICQTCEYQGVDFLDFLRSGEKDIHAFAEKQRRRTCRSPNSKPQTSPPDAAAKP